MSQNSFTNTIYLSQADVKRNRELIKDISHVEKIFLRKCYGCVVISHDDDSYTHAINLHISECVLVIPGRVLNLWACFELYNCFVISGCVSILTSILWFLAVFWVFYKCFISTRYFVASSSGVYFCALAGSFCMSKFVAYIFLANWPGIIEKCSLKREVVFSDNDLALLPTSYLLKHRSHIWITMIILSMSSRCLLVMSCLFDFFFFCLQCRFHNWN